MTTTPMGVDSDDTGTSVDGAVDAFLNKWKDAGSLSDTDEGAKTPPRRRETVRQEEEDESDEDLLLEDEDGEDDEDDSSSNDDEDDGDSTDADELVEASDEAVVKITVDGEERNVPVKDLKRLFGQEASLTRKSQEVAQARKAAEDEGTRFTLATSKLMERAQERFQPYASIDWQIAQKTLNTEEFVALRQEASAAYEDLKFLNEELNGTFETTKKERAESQQEAAKAAVEVLQKNIPNWSAEVYTGILDYAETQGLDKQDFSQVVNPHVLTLVYKAKAYDDAKARAAEKRKTAVTTTSKRTMKSQRRPSASIGKPGDDAAFARLKKSGSTDDAVNAFLSRWESQSNN